MTKITRDGYFNKFDVIQDSKNRVLNNQLFNLIDSNAKWLAERRKVNSFPLDYNNYKLNQAKSKKEIESFKDISDYTNNLDFELFSNQSKKILDSQEFKEKKERWIKLLKSDIYINEGVNVLLNLKTKKINQRSILAKVD